MMKPNNSRPFFVYYAGWGMQCCGEPILTLRVDRRSQNSVFFLTYPNNTYLVLGGLAKPPQSCICGVSFFGGVSQRR